MNPSGPRLPALAAVALDAIGELYSCLVPSPCLVCGEMDGPLCTGCRQSSRTALQPRSQEAAESAMRLPLTGSGALPAAWAGGEYTGLRSRLMLAYKAGGARCLAPELAPFLRAALNELSPGRGDVLLPIPTTTRSYLRRGFDPVSLLLDRCRIPQTCPGALRAEILCPRQSLLAGLLSLPDGAGDAGGRTWLWHSGGQKGLGARARARRTQSAFRLRGAEEILQSGSVRRIIVVDDVLTTGATVGAAMRTLLEAGYRGELACAVALAAKSTGRGDGEAEPLRMIQEF